MTVSGNMTNLSAVKACWLFACSAERWVRFLRWYLVVVLVAVLFIAVVWLLGLVTILVVLLIAILTVSILFLPIIVVSSLMVLLVTWLVFWELGTLLLPVAWRSTIVANISLRWRLVLVRPLTVVALSILVSILVVDISLVSISAVSLVVSIFSVFIFTEVILTSVVLPLLVVSRWSVVVLSKDAALISLFRCGAWGESGCADVHFFLCILKYRLWFFLLVLHFWLVLLFGFLS